MGWAARANQDRGPKTPKPTLHRYASAPTQQQIDRTSKAFGGGQAGSVLAAMMLGVAPPRPTTPKKPSMTGGR